MAATPPNVVFQWLDRIGLGYAVPNFSAYSIDSPQKLMGIDVKTYSALGVLNQEDRKRLFELVQRVRDVSPFLSFHDTSLQPGVAVCVKTLALPTLTSNTPHPTQHNFTGLPKDGDHPPYAEFRGRGWDGQWWW